MTSAALWDDPEPDRLRRECVATADRVFAGLVGEVEAGRGRRSAALRPWLPVPGGVPGAPPGAAAGDAEPDPQLDAEPDAEPDRGPAVGAGDGPDGHGGVPLVLVARPGACVATSVWVHNVGPGPATALDLRLTALTTDDGAAIAASHGSLRPGRVDVPAAASAEVRVTVRVPPDAVPGTYRGHVRGEGPPGTSAVPVRLVVRA